MRFLNDKFGMGEAAIVAAMTVAVFAVRGRAPAMPSSDTGEATATFPVPATETPEMTELLDDFRDGNSPGSIAIGVAEGTRTVDGGTTWAYSLHIDPGNRAENVGTFSCQIGTCRSRVPHQADAELLEKRIRPLLKKAMELRPDLNRLELWVFADMLVQAPTAAYGTELGAADPLSPSFLKDYDTTTDRARGLDGLADARTRAFYNSSGILNAPGLGNSPARVRADQMRRTQALAAVMLATDGQ